MAAITGISLAIASMIMGVPILRDFEYNIEALMFVNPIRKRDYLLGRFLGSYAVLLFAFSGMLLGFTVGEFMPWHNPNHLLPFNFLRYLEPFILIALPIVFFGATVFFVSGFLSRKLIVVYTQAIFIFVLFVLTKSIKNEFLQALLDPFSLTTLTDMTEGWSIAERNFQFIPFNDVLLYNKLFWIAIGIVVSIIGYSKFNFNVVRDKTSKKRQKKVSNESYSLPNFKNKVPVFTISMFYFKSILKETSFWAIVLCGMVIIIINSISLGTVYDVDSYPKTYFIVKELQEMSGFFFVIILVFYSGELIWKERTTKLNLIYDATPIANFINLSGKFIGLILIYFVLMLTLVAAGVLFQTANGYYNYELQVYFNGFILELLPLLVLYTFMAFFFQVLLNQKFIGIIAILFFLIGNVILGFMGVEHDLLSFGGSTLTFYSDMNGYGHFLRPYLWVKAYWFLFCIILYIATVVFSVRGTETNLKKRWKLSKYNFTKPLQSASMLILILFLLTGSYIYYNTNILNTYWTNVEEQEYQLGYEQTLKKFEHLPQPKITAVNLNIELYPNTRAYTSEGYYILKNTSNVIIKEVHVQKLIESNVTLDYVTFEGGATEDRQYDKYDYFIYKLKKTLQPGDTVKMRFKQSFTTKGFEVSDSNPNIVENGSFFTNKNFPTLGYNRKYELSDKDERAAYKLPIRSSKAPLKDAFALQNARSGSDSEGIQLEMIIGTTADQTAIAPGKLINQWKEEDRNYFHYKTSQPIVDFYAVVSARYELEEDIWFAKSDTIKQAVALQIYYHKGHDYNLDRMMQAMKKSLDYFSANFSPYQYEHFRIMEFPRYAAFAQSFPGTVPFSEAIGFVLDIDDEKDVDMAFYITAHELAHQWFGMQIEAANVQGQHFILETLAQYAAIMVLKQNYPEDKVNQFLALQKETYLEGQLREALREPPLALVENQDYVYYAKGVINMYVLQELIGEANVNLALKRFLNDWNSFKGPKKMKTRNYATSTDLLGYFKEVTPDSLQHLVKDLFETVTLYKNRTKAASYEKVTSNQYKVYLEIETSKYRIDDQGNEISVPVDDWIDIGIYGKEVDGKKTLIYLQKHHINKKQTLVEIEVNQQPTSASIDPHNLLMDRDFENNSVDFVEHD